ncbi:putative glucose-6-phosphate 1-epimerase [Apostichopus japonicus]|uniref:Galactose mutarotase n=1 Tax=Stichopus japonicus TaxID=307972 RepID=A0A2G8LA78_STIJA|nr:putative glucose-6-phosphate 1-epimerase [Apostichopus japonicus]
MAISGPAKDNKDRKSGDVSATFTMEDSEETRKIWNYSFKLTYTVTLKAKSLLLEFTVDNKGQEAFDFTCLLTHIWEWMTSHRHRWSDCKERNMMTRIYKSTPNELTVKNTKGGKSVIIKKNNFPDAVVWNPWIEKAKAMSDFGDDEYLVMLCVEAGFVAKPFHLEPSETFQASQELSLA